MRITTLVENSGSQDRHDLRPEFGLSLHVEVGRSRVLFDMGSSDAFLGNAEALGIDVGAVDAAVVSHHHFDHGGGLAAFLEVNDHAPVYLRESPSRDRWFRAFGFIRRPIGLDEAVLESHRDRIRPVTGQAEIAPGVFLLTDIGAAHPRPAGNRRLYVQRDGRLERDPFGHELLMVVCEGEETVVFSGCSHNGILNMIDAAQAAFPDRTMTCLVGGFHLIGLPFYDSMAASRREVEAIGRAIVERIDGPVFTGHCTGKKAFGVLERTMGGALHRLATGTVVEP